MFLSFLFLFISATTILKDVSFYFSKTIFVYIINRERCVILTHDTHPPLFRLEFCEDYFILGKSQENCVAK